MGSISSACFRLSAFDSSLVVKVTLTFFMQDYLRCSKLVILKKFWLIMFIPITSLGYFIFRFAGLILIIERLDSEN